MSIDDPHTWAQGAAALKTAFDMFRSAIGLYRDVRPGAESPEQTKAITAALDQAEAAARVAEAEIAKALGYELCKCEFPPTVMLSVGYTTDRGKEKGGPVFECPKCGYNTSGGWAFDRLAPRRDAKKSS
jgi:hypothetical protein